MIYLKQNGKDYEHDIRTMLQAFFEHEKIVMEPTDARLMLETFFCEKQQVTFVLKDRDGYEDIKKIQIAYADQKHARNPIKKLLYHMLVQYTGIKLPWGTLTGVRPTKIASRLLEQGASDEIVIKHFQDMYDTTLPKIKTCCAIAKKEQKLFQSFSFEKEYCLYISIPFCPSKCLYCSFPSDPIEKYKDKIDQYLDALCKEIEYVAKAKKQQRLIAVYIGGGTPSALPAECLERLLNAVQNAFCMNYVKEFCVECGRPDSITREKLLVLKKMGVERISINPQTMKDETLKLIGRMHTAEQTKQAYALAREVGFFDINMDVIIGLPKEELSDIKYTIEQVYEMKPESVTVHSLSIKRASHLHEEIMQYRSMIQENAHEMMELVDDYARKMNLFPYYLYRQKNISGKLENIGYAKEGKECLYNILIMEEKMDVMAVGAGAITKLILSKENGMKRIPNVKNIDAYITRIDEMIQRKQVEFLSEGKI